MSYHFVDPETNAALAVRGYSPNTLPAQYQTPALPGLAGQPGEDNTLRNLLIVVGVVLLAWWFYKRAAKRNPGVSRVAKIIKGLEGAWYWRLLRKKAKRHGPFASATAAAEAAEAAGYEVME